MREIAAVIATALGRRLRGREGRPRRAHRALMDRYPLYPQLSPTAASARCLSGARFAQRSRPLGCERGSRMKVWVDCTAAAHPLVLRPIVERLEAQGHEVFITAREYGQTLGILDRLGMPYTVGRRARRRLDSWARCGRWAGARRGWRGWSGSAGRSWGSATARSTSPSSPRCFRFPSVQMQDYEFARLQRQVAFRLARRVLVPDSIPLERLAQDRRQGREAGPLPGPEGGVLPGRLRARPGGPRRARRSTARRCWSWCGRRRRPPSTTRPTTSTRRRSAASPRRPAAQAVIVPRTERAGRGGAGARRRQPDRPRAGDRRPEPDRLRRPRGQRGGDDEPRGGRPRHARLHHLQPAAWAGSTRR